MHQRTDNDVTEIVRRFYEKNPFPNYEDLDTIGSLRSKVRAGNLAKILDDQLPKNIDILECGCGTGQLTNFLASGNRNVYGTDISISSLSLAQNFKTRNNLERASFMQMNIFKPLFKEKSFDLVICNDVLHHTSDPRRGFDSIARLVKPNGFIIIGLYHRYSRLARDLRCVLFRLTERSVLHSLDPQLRKIGGADKRQAWFMDQYRNPYETKHTIYEIRSWCAKAGFTVVNTLPKTLIGDAMSTVEKLFQMSEMPGRVESFLTEFSQAFRKNPEGGVFIVVAKRSDNAGVSL